MLRTDLVRELNREISVIRTFILTIGGCSLSLPSVTWNGIEMFSFTSLF